ncbi:MAG: SusE domain-containing protein [Bacteroidales bacterium]|nr:SusE domain-containing protein [Bacteroidales bacterium]
MKKIFTFIAAALALATGCQRYELNTEFSLPDELVSPSEVTLDVTSSNTVVLSWNGGGAADGGLVLYNVLFDKVGGDFSDPIAVLPSDLGARSTLTLSHAQLNTFARKAGVKPNEKGSFIWTVSGSKGGNVKVSDKVGTLSVVRGEGIDNIPEKLFIGGAAAKEAGQEFRCVEEGLFVIFTEVVEGNATLSSQKNGSAEFFVNAEGKLAEGDGSIAIPAVETGLARITINFNTLSTKVESIGKEVRLIWGANYYDVAVLEYTGNGNFQGDGDVMLLGPGRDGTPDWCSWTEERYYFIAKVNGEDMCWGHSFDDQPGNAWTPDGTDKYWEVAEHSWEQWNWLWKMDHAMDLKHGVFTMETNHDNRWIHSYVGGEIKYDQPSAAPEALTMGGSAAEADGQALRKEGNKFVIYNKLKEGELTLVDGNGTKYFADADGKLFIGNRKTAVAASEGVTRVTVDFDAKTVTYDAIGANVWVENAWDHIVMATLDYQGLGKWAGEGQIKFAASGDERYSLRTTVNGTNMRWGSNKGNDGKLPETDEEWWLYESEWEGHQWDNLYKFNKDDQDKNATFIVDGNNPVHMTHSVIVASGDPVAPSVAPADLSLSGSGAEVDGQAFRKVSDGVFTVFARLKDGELCFKSGSKNYFNDAAKGLLEGEGTGVSVASAAGHVSRVTVDFVNCTVKVESVNEYAHLKYAADYRDLAHLQYVGNGVFKAENFKVDFIDPSKPDTNPPSWLSWLEERYYYIVEIDGVEKCWGMQTGAVHNDLKYNNDESFWGIEEFAWSQWDHCWKFSGDVNGANIDVEINTNADGKWIQTITKK